MHLYRNKKNGKLYIVVSDGIDCTNSRDGTAVVIYQRADEVSRMFVREAVEFAEKFELVHETEE